MDENNAPAPVTGVRHSRAFPVAIGAVIAAGGLVFGGLAAANASNSSHHHKHPSIAAQAKHEAHTDAGTPKNGNKILNVNVLEDRIEHYYGSASATYPTVGKVTIPAKNGAYAKQLRGITAREEKYFAKAKKAFHGSKKPALVFDIDDTLVNTYDYTLAAQFGYDPTANAVYIDNAAFPAVFGMPKLIREARHEGYRIFFITGRPESQRAATKKDLKADGYGSPKDSHLFLKPSDPPAYLHCPSAGCSTTQYKSGTRKHITSEGNAILGAFGDQYSDLLGGDAGHKVKIPNPMYYIP